MSGRRVVCGALLLALVACADEEGGLPPPGFGGGQPRFFFPTALVLSPVRDSLFVANSDFNRAFTSATLLEIPLSLFDDAAAEADGVLASFGSSVLSQGRVHRFGSEMVATSSALYLVTADPNALVRIPLDASGAVACPDDDCRTDALDLDIVDMQDPTTVELVSLVLPGAQAEELVLLVAHTNQTLDEEDQESGLPARVAVIPERLASASAQPFSNGAFTVEIGFAASALVFDPTTRRALLGGCFEVVKGATGISCAGNPSNPFERSNLMRAFSPELGPDTPVDELALGGALFGGGIAALERSSDGQTLYALTTAPDALVAFETPRPGTPATQRPSLIVPLPEAPSNLAIIPATGGELLAITARNSDALLIVDPRSGVVVSQIQPVGRRPFGLEVMPVVDGHRVFVTLFDGCGVAAVDVPDSTPTSARLVGTVGACP